MPRDQRALTYRVRQLPPDINKASLVHFLLRVLATDDVVPTIEVFSLARSLTSPDAANSKDATIAIYPLPPLLENGKQWSFPAEHGNSQYRIVVDLHFLDFTVLNEVHDDDHVLNCIAISGLASHPFGSWQCRSNEHNFMWLRDGLPKAIPGIRAITYGYDTHLNDSTSFKSIPDIALELVNRLTAVGLGWLSSKPTVFIAHSMGGIILKEALVVLAPTCGEEPSILGKLEAILFFGVPNGGMETDQLISMVNGNPTEELISKLSPASDYLKTLDSYFSNLQYTRKFPVISCYETKTTQTVMQSADGKWSRSGPRKVMVKKESAIQNCSRAPLGEVRPIDQDHSAMVKFAPGDIHYTVVLDCLRKITGQATSLGSATSDPKTAGNESFEHGNRYKDERGRPNTKQPRDYSTAEILHSLWMDVFDHRLDDISPRFQSTFEWMFSDESLDFAPWLLDGTGAYWIEGKPGAGKSTLMKFAFQDSRTRELLENWDQPGSFVKAGFFFHHRGSKAQKSFEGMLRSLLHQILRDVPSLCQEIPKACLPATEKESFDWSLTNLRHAFFSILEQKHTQLKLCLFIDALDELDGHLELISAFMKNLIQHKPGSAVRCKVFFSTRPRQIIQTHFEQYTHFRIQDKTEKDVRTYTEGRLAECLERFSVTESLHAALEEAAYLVESILAKADGVFLWVKLAMQDINLALRQSNDPTVRNLEVLLERVPRELDEFYHSIVERIPQDFRWEAYLVLEVILRAEGEIGLKDIYSIVRCSPCKTAQECHERLKHPADAKAVSNWLETLKDRCGGLLELNVKNDHIQLMHETVRAFLSQPGLRQLFFRQSIVSRPQNGYTELAKLMLTRALYPYIDPLQIQRSYYHFSPKCMEYCFMAEKTTLTCHQAWNNYLVSQILECLSPWSPNSSYTCGENLNHRQKLRLSIQIQKNLYWSASVKR
ncbi:small s protein [Diplodia corticola]|uniref:Small s protein n=1 Tax=Diplodia corticola TaxID=236234 RepID=A0A1J9RGQ8_9PEZI|nr:small s protein [Diplodia corticola]OJD31723.1 small s protein [Diplodia corticola]